MSEDRRSMITLRSLFSKEVVNTVTGERLGYIDNAEIDTEKGYIKCFCVSEGGKNPFAKKRNVRKFGFCDICKIGDDIILINACRCVEARKCENSKNSCKTQKNLV